MRAIVTVRRDVPSATRAAVAGLASLAGFLALYYVFVRTHRGQRLDQTALDHVGGSSAGLRVADLLQYVTIGALALVVIVAGYVAVVHRRWAFTGGAVALVAGAMATTEIMKHHVLDRPSYGYGYSNSLPSGHTTIVASLALAGLLVIPRKGRWIVGLAGSVGIAITGVGTVVAGWHRPSDVVAALAVTFGWGALVLALLSVVHGTEPGAQPTARPIGLGIGLALAAALFVVLGVRPNGSATDLGVHVITMCGISLIGAAVVGGFAWMVESRFR